MPRSHRDEREGDRKSSDRKRSSSRRDRDRSPEDEKEDRKSSDRKRSSSRREDDDEEERLLRKAKEYVEKEKRKKSSHDDRRSRKSSSRRSRSPSSSEDSRSRKRHRDEEKEDRKSDHKRSRREDDRHREEDRKSDRKRSRRDDDSDSEDERHRRRKDDNNKSSSSRKHHSDSDESRDRKKHSSSKEKSKHHDDRKHKKDHKHKKDIRKDDRKDSKKDKKKKDRKSDEKSGSKPKAIVKPDKSKLMALGPPPGKPPSKLLDTEDDYFSFHQSLWVWLYREEGRAFNDLTSDETREAFGRFVKRYNAGMLEAAYYGEKGLPPKAVEECKTTRHKWSFQTSETERRGLQMLQDGVRKLTEYTAEADNNPNAATCKTVPPAFSKAPAVAPRPEAEETDEGRRRAWTAEERTANRVANRRMREHVRTAEEEFGGGRADYGRERQLEKKKEVAAKIHGAAKDREDMGVTISDDALYGDGRHGSSFQAALARERQRKQKKEESKQARIQELQQKEDNKKQAMLDMLGLGGMAASGQKIKIAPRKDG